MIDAQNKIDSELEMNSNWASLLKKIIDELVKQNIEDVIEDIEALSSKRFMKSITKSRKEYKEGRFV